MTPSLGWCGAEKLVHLIAGRHDVFALGGGPASWKPLPVAFTTVFGFFGAAPKLWVALARAAGLLGPPGGLSARVSLGGLVALAPGGPGSPD